MDIFLITFLAMIAFILMMSIGVIFGMAPVKGSCGGLGKVMGSCNTCACKDDDAPVVENTEDSVLTGYKQSLELLRSEVDR